MPGSPRFDGPTVELRAGRERGAIALLDTYGYAAIRSFWQMAMDLDDVVRGRRGARGRDDPTGRDGGRRPGRESVVNTAFRSHFGHVEETFEEWLAQQEADDTWDPTLGLLAEVDGTTVGFSNNGVIDDIGYVFELGVLPEMQGEESGGPCSGIPSRCWRRVGSRKDAWGSTRRRHRRGRALPVGRADPGDRAPRGREARRGRLGY